MRKSNFNGKISLDVWFHQSISKANEKVYFLIHNRIVVLQTFFFSKTSTQFPYSSLNKFPFYIPVHVRSLISKAHASFVLTAVLEKIPENWKSVVVVVGSLSGTSPSQSELSWCSIEISCTCHNQFYLSVKLSPFPLLKQVFRQINFSEVI